MTITKYLSLAMLLTACGGGEPWVPLTASARSPGQTLVWVGRGECERMGEDGWRRAPELDYEFTVEQHRIGDRWQSVKSLRRLHPAYDGAAGERFQTYFFELELQPTDASGRVPARLQSSLGPGSGSSDREFRNTSFEIRATGISDWAPYDRFRIEQRYDYEAGQLDETVSLDKGSTPWVRNREHAKLFAEHRFDHAPTRR